MVVVDGHAHAFLPHSESYPRQVDELAPAERAATVEELLATMEAHDVDRAVLVPLGPEDDYLAHCLRSYRDRFVGIGVADDETLGRTSQDPVAHLRGRVKRTGIRGLRMSWLGEPGAAITESPAFGVLQELSRQGLVLWFYAPPEQLRPLRKALRELPQLPVVLNHLGCCPSRMTVDAHQRPRVTTELPPPTLPDVVALAEFPEVRVMVSGQYAWSAEPPPYSDLDPIVEALYRAYGAERMMWASDFPWPRQVPGYRVLRELPLRHLTNLTDAEREAIFGGTALRLFERW